MELLNISTHTHIHTPPHFTSSTSLRNALQESGRYGWAKWFQQWPQELSWWLPDLSRLALIREKWFDATKAIIFSIIEPSIWLHYHFLLEMISKLPVTSPTGRMLACILFRLQSTPDSLSYITHLEDFPSSFFYMNLWSCFCNFLWCILKGDQLYYLYYMSGFRDIAF